VGWPGPISDGVEPWATILRGKTLFSFVKLVELGGFGKPENLLLD
jgi:hypothetical protein